MLNKYHNVTHLYIHTYALLKATTTFLMLILKARESKRKLHFETKWK